VQARVLRSGQQRFGLDQRQRLRRPPGAALRDVAQQDDVALDLISGLRSGDGALEDGPDFPKRGGAEELRLVDKPPVYVIR